MIDQRFHGYYPILSTIQKDLFLEEFYQKGLLAVQRAYSL
ncbi:hypothetical protein PU02_1243 [Bartonella ancashensis]|uniref:Uncharacterized protein n=1 Tax=Bartonella ancashensis TaxID=1318743 RepID=A0A0M4LHE0_9HYPH|nr:hypothetical protein PU02_1243 [Bartonella ancashensis]